MSAMRYAAVVHAKRDLRFECVAEEQLTPGSVRVRFGCGALCRRKPLVQPRGDRVRVEAGRAARVRGRQALAQQPLETAISTRIPRITHDIP